MGGGGVEDSFRVRRIHSVPTLDSVAAAAVVEDQQIRSLLEEPGDLPLLQEIIRVVRAPMVLFQVLEEEEPVAVKLLHLFPKELLEDLEVHGELPAPRELISQRIREELAAQQELLFMDGVM